MNAFLKVFPKVHFIIFYQKQVLRLPKSWCGYTSDPSIVANAKIINNDNNKLKIIDKFQES